MAKKKQTASGKKANKSGKHVYLFGKSKTDGNGGMKPLLGGKGAGLAEMCRIGLPVPPGFTITTEVCDLYYKSGRKLPAGLMEEVARNVAMLEKQPAAALAPLPGNRRHRNTFTISARARRTVTAE